MKKLKKDLQAVLKSLNALTKKAETLAKKVDKLEKSQAVKKPKPKAKAKTTRKATAKKKAVAKKPTAKKAKATTATDRALNIIYRAKKGVDVPTLIKKTGFDEKKVRNIVSRAFAQEKIKRAERGKYVGV